MKPINATKSLMCDYCNEKLVNYQGQDKIRYICSLQENPTTCSKPCTMYDWNRCEKNEDK